MHTPIQAAESMIAERDYYEDWHRFEAERSDYKHGLWEEDDDSDLSVEFHVTLLVTLIAANILVWVL